MDREKAKELLPIIQAFAEGKTIQVFISCKDRWEDNNNPLWDANADKYRIKPEPKYRPFKDVDECWEEMQKHQPFGWVENKNSHRRYILTTMDPNPAYSDCNVRIGETWRGLEYLFEKYTFADRTPFGKLEE